jgi:hypothetical protein
MNTDDIKAQFNVINSFIEIIEAIIEKDDVDILMLKDMVNKLKRANNCFIEIL